MMRQKLFTIGLLLFILKISVSAQDLVVQSLIYDSETRDTVISFPTDDHNKWEKIIMKYSMRCKDGLVSSGASGQTNRGCGEWDYSCNTYITDSTKVDSTYRVSPDYIISNFSGEKFDYVSYPTYSYIESTFKEVNISSTNSETSYLLSTSNNQSDILSGSQGDQKRMQFLLTKSMLEAGNFTAGNISGIALDVISGQADMSYLKVKLSHSNQGTLNQCFETQNSQEVYYQNKNISASDNTLYFYEPFIWDGVSNVLVDISASVKSSNLIIASNDQSNNSTVLSSSNNGFIKANGSGNIEVQGDFSGISDEITISYWIKGSAVLPVNSTILEGIDTDNNRQVNIHMPWSNSQVYWDCGNDGSGYDRINKLAFDVEYKNKWNHWAFTKNATTGSMQIYLNGTLWHSGSGNTKSMNIDRLFIGSSWNKGVSYFGDIDDLRIWNKALNANEIDALLCHGSIESDPNVANQVIQYTFDNDEENMIIDSSPNGYHAIADGIIGQYREVARDMTGVINRQSDFPVVSLIRGDYNMNVSEVISLDSIKNMPYQVDQYDIIDGNIEIVASNTYYKSGQMPVTREDGSFVYYKIVDPEGSINIGQLEYYAKSPMIFEIMSFVTPYGINLDLGIDGETWTFDITDFGPILKGDKRIFLTRGGQWQEDMDIRFEFYEGTPSRNVKSINQIWPVTMENYQTIQSDLKYEPRTVTKETADESVVIKTTITGHGQEGEFISRRHFIKYNNIPLEWSVWTECAENPIYPQGGTWVYDRAGWCPGAASDTKVWDFTQLMQEGDVADIDYGVVSASGDSRYIVSSQVVKYGPANFTLDAGLKDIIYPSQKIEYGRFNPTCGRPKVMIVNNGSTKLTNLTIQYGIEGGPVSTYQWSGDLDFLEEEEVELYYLPSLASSAANEIFYARVSNPNNTGDQYESNNELQSTYTPVMQMSNEVIIVLKTNNNGNETGYKVYDEYGEVVLSKGPFGLNNNTTYTDTLKNIDGCHKIVVTDSGGNGLQWWANPNGGAGYIRIKNPGGFWNEFPTDFGGYYEMDFVAGMITNTENTVIDNPISIYPNPAQDQLQVICNDLKNPKLLNILDNQGRIVQSISLNSALTDIHQSVNINSLVSGIYMLQIIDEKMIHNAKFIKS